MGAGSDRGADAGRHAPQAGERRAGGHGPFRLPHGGGRRAPGRGSGGAGILARIRELKAAGRTTRQIADELNRQGYTTRRGTAWRFQYVAEASGRRREVTHEEAQDEGGAEPKPDQAWFEHKVAELAAELEKLPADRQEQFERELTTLGQKGGKLSGPAHMEKLTAEQRPAAKKVAKRPRKGA